MNDGRLGPKLASGHAPMGYRGMTVGVTPLLPYHMEAPSFTLERSAAGGGETDRALRVLSPRTNASRARGGRQGRPASRSRWPPSSIRPVEPRKPPADPLSRMPRPAPFSLPAAIHSRPRSRLHVIDPITSVPRGLRSLAKNGSHEQGPTPFWRGTGGPPRSARGGPRVTPLATPSGGYHPAGGPKRPRGFLMGLFPEPRCSHPGTITSPRLRLVK